MVLALELVQSFGIVDSPKAVIPGCNLEERIVANPTLHYLVSHRPEYFVAHCLDLGIMATGPEIDEALRRLDLLVRASLLVPGGMKKSSQEYWDRFSQAQPYGERSLEWNLSGFKLLEPDTGEPALSPVQIRHAA